MATPIGLSLSRAEQIAGTLGFPSKMPGTAYGIPAKACITGSKLAKIEGSVCFGCYALKANYKYPAVAKSHATRLAAIQHPLWSEAMVVLLNHAHERACGRNGAFSAGWHRWHDSGDLQSVEHLEKIVAVCNATPHIKHWLPTREFAIVKAFITSGGIVPVNLVIRVSATMVDGNATSAWPHTSGVHKHAAPQGLPCGAKGDKAKSNPDYGKCGDCRACWNADVPHVSYPLH